MITSGRVAAVLLIGAIALGASGAARADDELPFFEGLIIGQAMDESELDAYYGKGNPQFTLECSGGNCVYAPEGNTANQSSNMSGVVTGNQGNTVSQQSVGDYNTLSTTIQIYVNIGTVTVLDSAGASVTVNQTTDLTGALVQGQAP